MYVDMVRINWQISQLIRQGEERVIKPLKWF